MEKTMKRINIRKTAALLAAALIPAMLASCTGTGGGDTVQETAEVTDVSITEPVMTPLEMSYDKPIMGFIPDDGALPHMQIGDGIRLIAVGAYTGEFYEDGSGDLRENTLAVTVFNDTDKDIEMFEVTMSTGDAQNTFIGSSLPAQSEMLVCEREGASFADNSVYSDVKLDAVSWFDSPMTLSGDTFTVQTKSSVINVQNISDTDKTGVYIYYKYMSGDVYIGGITRRINYGDIGAGAIKQANEALFSDAKCRIVMVSCNE